MARVAAAPISWGVCEVPGWGRQLPPDRVLAEMASLGFTHTELGSVGWLPTESGSLEAALAAHELGLLASFVPLVLHDPHLADSSIADATVAAELLEATGARYFNTAPVTSRDWQPRSPVSEAGWAHLYEMLGRIEEICVDHGLEQVVHSHVGCVVETAPEVRRLLDNTSVALVLDTGHLAIGGFDPLIVARNHADRVGLVHLKDVDLSVAERLNTGHLTLMEAVQGGLFPPLGAGDLPLADVVVEMERAGFEGWYVIEQDCALTGAEPAAGEGPVRDVANSVAFLRAMWPTGSNPDGDALGSNQTTRGGNPQ